MQLLSGCVDAILDRLTPPLLSVYHTSQPMQSLSATTSDAFVLLFFSQLMSARLCRLTFLFGEKYMLACAGCLFEEKYMLTFLFEEKYIRLDNRSDDDRTIINASKTVKDFKKSEKVIQIFQLTPRGRGLLRYATTYPKCSGGRHHRDRHLRGRRDRHHRDTCRVACPIEVSCRSWLFGGHLRKHSRPHDRCPP